MARRPRIAVPASPHHIIQRGNNRQAIFFTEDDYRFYLAVLRQAKTTCQCRIYAYVLMTNHVQRYINDTYQRSGTLWEGRYKRAVISRDEYVLRYSRSIEWNPVRAGMVQHPGESRWSSYRSRALGVPDALLDADPWYTGLGTHAKARQQAYQAWVDSPMWADEWTHIRQATQQGRLIGMEQVQREIEGMLGRQATETAGT